MRVVATAGHVDHGKSTLVRALTGMEPDRWAEERRRGMTIDLGYAWTEIRDESVAFVDVPGHQRFIANTLAGLGPAPAVMFVVAADQGWQAQSAEHLAVVRALGLRHVVLAVTRSDLADPRPALATAQRHVREAGLDAIRSVTVSGRTGAGLEDLREALAAMISDMAQPRAGGRVRLWVDRAFTVTGSGTVITGTLDAGTVHVGEAFDIGPATVRVRGLQCAGRSQDVVHGPARVAVNLRGIGRDHVRRGDVLLTPGAWPQVTTFDVRLDEPGWKGDGMLHVGTVALSVHVRPLGESITRLTAQRPLPLVHGDRAVLREPGTRAITGVEVLDVDPPALHRRGSAARRGHDLALSAAPNVDDEVARRGAMKISHLRLLGFDPADADGARTIADWLVAEQTWMSWIASLVVAVDDHACADLLARGLGVPEAATRIGLPDHLPIRPLADAAGLDLCEGLLSRPGAVPTLGPAEQAVHELETRLAEAPFRAPDRAELHVLGLGERELAAAARSGRLLRLPDGVILRADAPRIAAAALQKLPQPFTMSEARVELGTTRRVAIPLLEHLDSLGVTERVDATRRRTMQA